MENIIIPIVSEEMISFANETAKRNNTRVLIGVVESLSKQIRTPKKFDGEIKIFADNTKKESMINSLCCCADEGKILICRKSVSEEEIQKFFASKTDITVCEEKHNKFKNFFYKVWQYIIKLLFGFNFFDGDISIVCFSEKLYPVVSSLSNISFQTRVNRWKYVSVSQVATKGPVAVKEYNKTRTIATFLSWVFLFLATIVSTIVFYLYFNAKFITCLLFACAILLSLVGVIISGAIFNLNVRVGQKNFDKAKVILKGEGNEKSKNWN